MQSCRPLTPSPSGAARSSACPSQVRGLAGGHLRGHLLCQIINIPGWTMLHFLALPCAPVMEPLDVDSEPSLPIPSLCTVSPAYHFLFRRCCYAVIKPLDVESEPGSSSGVGATVRPDCSVHLGALHGCCAAALCSAV